MNKNTITWKVILTITGEPDAVAEVNDLFIAGSIFKQLEDDLTDAVKDVLVSAGVGSDFKVSAAVEEIPEQSDEWRKLYYRRLREVTKPIAATLEELGRQINELDASIQLILGDNPDETTDEESGEQLA